MISSCQSWGKNFFFKSASAESTRRASKRLASLLHGELRASSKFKLPQILTSTYQSCTISQSPAISESVVFCGLFLVLIIGLYIYTTFLPPGLLHWNWLGERGTKPPGPCLSWVLLIIALFCDSVLTMPSNQVDLLILIPSQCKSTQLQYTPTHRVLQPKIWWGCYYCRIFRDLGIAKRAMPFKAGLNKCFFRTFRQRLLWRLPFLYSRRARHLRDTRHISKADVWCKSIRWNILWFLASLPLEMRRSGGFPWANCTQDGMTQMVANSQWFLNICSTHTQLELFMSLWSMCTCTRI